MDQRAEQILGRAAMMLTRAVRPEAARFLAVVQDAVTTRFNTTGFFGEHVLGTDGMVLKVPPERFDEWDHFKYAITDAIKHASDQVPGRLVTEVEAIPAADDYDPNWRNL